MRRALRGADGVLGRGTADGTRPPGPPARSTGCSWTRPAPASARCAGGPRRAGAGSPPTWTTLVPLQRALLSAALDSVRPGGVVLYATCSPVLAETSGVVAAVLAARDDAVLGDAAALLPDVPDCAGPLPGTFQLWPHRHGTDAMFGALLRGRA